MNVSDIKLYKGRVIRAEDQPPSQDGPVTSVQEQAERDIQALLDNARDEAAELKRQAVVEANATKARSAIDLIKTLRQEFDASETELIELVMNCVRAIVGEFDDRERVKRLVLIALNGLKDKRRAVIRVPAGDPARKPFEDAIADPRLSFRIKKIEEDPDLAAGHYWLDAGSYSIRIDLQAQLAGLTAALRAGNAAALEKEANTPQHKTEG